MTFKSRYVSKTPDNQGFVEYTDDENAVWKTLYDRQMTIIDKYACEEFTKGIKLLEFTNTKIPQLPNVNKNLFELTGWKVDPVAALISTKSFFNLLNNRKFPAATFIRIREELDYVKEPDIFHELYGHCPILTEPVFAAFVKRFAERTLEMDEADWALMQRMFWFTVEFGLIKTEQGNRIYGGGITSSYTETMYSIDSDIPERRPFVPLDVFRTPYRIDILQPTYFVIDSFKDLYDFIESDIESILAKARQLGEFEPNFKVDKSQNIHIHCC